MQEREQPETLRLKQAMPAMTVNDLAKSVAWYRDVLGFIVVEEHEMDGQVVGASLRAGAVDILLGQDDFKKGRDRVKGVGMRLYCTTGQDVDELAERIKAAGGELAAEPTNQPWGARDFAIQDPDGFLISISTLPAN